MSIYIFEPGGSGTTPTFQQVLTSGSLLTMSNVIDINNNNFWNYNGNFIYGDSTGIQVEFKFVFSVDANNNSCTFSGYTTGVQTGINLDLKQDYYTLGSITNATYLEIDGVGRNFSINCGSLNINSDNSINQTTDTIIYTSFSVGSLTSTSSGGNSGNHLKIRIDGVNYKIALLNP